MELESKQVGVEAKAIDDAEGTVQAVVSVTNIVDNVKDVIEPGAYEQTLGKRVPKGVWSHDTTIPIAKTLSAIELDRDVAIIFSPRYFVRPCVKQHWAAKPTSHHHAE